MIQNEIPLSKVLVTGARIRPESRVSLGSMLSYNERSVPLAYLRVLIELEGTNEHPYYVQEFADVFLSAITGDIVVSAEALLDPERKVSGQEYRPHVLNTVLYASLRQVRFDFGVTNECRLWFTCLEEKPLAIIGSNEHFDRYFIPLVKTA